jgi:hypothetical protein
VRLTEALHCLPSEDEYENPREEFPGLRHFFRSSEQQQQHFPTFTHCGSSKTSSAPSHNQSAPYLQALLQEQEEEE